MHESGCNYLQACLLLLLAERSDYGYDLAPRLLAFGLDNVDTASVYRALRALERSALVGSFWRSSQAGPARRVYRVTTEGRATIAAFGANLRRDQARAAHYLSRLGSLCAPVEASADPSQAGSQA